MRIAQINETNPTSNFRGLWGYKRGNTIYHETMGSETVDRFYYPFLDESEEEIKKVKEKYTKQSVNYNGGQYIMDYFENCHVMNKLRFTKSEWEQYSQNKSNIGELLKSIIETSIKKLKINERIRK